MKRINFSRKRKESEFWHWFQRNEKRLFTLDDEQDKIFDELLEELGKINSDLTFEIGPVEEGRREFIISAGGIRESFPAVVSLSDSAPSLPRWNIKEFRQRRWPMNSLQIEDLQMTPDEVFFSLEMDFHQISITLFFDKYDLDRPELFKVLGFLMLDEALGEYDVETKVSSITFGPFDELPDTNVYPLTRMPKMFDEIYASIFN